MTGWSAQTPMRVAVLASGSGSNLQALINACGPEAPARLVLVASERVEARALERARDAKITTTIIRQPSSAPELLEALTDAGADMVVLAGYLKLVPGEVIRAYVGRIVNIHPALLPAFGGPGMYGLRVHRAVLAAGATVSGATVHHVTDDYDAGPIVAQWPVAVRADDTPETLAARVLEAEHELLPAVVLAAARAGRVIRMVPAAQFGLPELAEE
ncbi:MAG TPA: phosphoribosylglycinamide formyltransferase [Gemmatimonadales bacterium]|nr:phosphoribosylglycinamide formyltransferase [Gemmatimonadales bacterium]